MASQTDGGSSFVVKIRTMSGVVRPIFGLRQEDSLATLIDKVIVELKVLACEVRLCREMCPFTSEQHSRTLLDLDISSGTELTFVRVPRITVATLQGSWVNSKGARIEVADERAVFSGMVSFELKTDGDGTVVGVGDHLTVQGLAGPEIVRFQEDTWWRLRDDSSEFAVILRTVGGGSTRIEGLRATDLFASLRNAAFEELKGMLDTTLTRMRICWGDYSYTGQDETKTLRDLGIGDGTTLLCVA